MKKKILLLAVLMLGLPFAAVRGGTVLIEAEITAINLETNEITTKNIITDEVKVYVVTADQATEYIVGFIMDIKIVDGVVTMHESWKNKFR